jgi:hypothetical protein
MKKKEGILKQYTREVKQNEHVEATPDRKTGTAKVLSLFDSGSL